MRSSFYNLDCTAQGQGGTLGPGEPQHSELLQISRAVHGSDVKDNDLQNIHFKSIPTINTHLNVMMKNNVVRAAVG